MSDPVTEYDAAAAFREYFARDPERGKGLTPLGWFLAGHERADSDLREAVRAALERHYEEPNAETRTVGHLATGIYRDDCVVCELMAEAQKRVHALRTAEEEAHKRLRIDAEDARDHVFRDMKR